MTCNRAEEGIFFARVFEQVNGVNDYKREKKIPFTVLRESVLTLHI